MHVSAAHWEQIEQILAHEDRAVLPLGSTEQHARLSLSTDTILAERMSLEAAEPLGVPVFPPLAYGVTPYFLAYPGTLSLRVQTYLSILRDLLDSLAQSGFRRILVVNGHGGNSVGATFCIEWMSEHPTVQVKWHDWWRGPRTWATVQAIDPNASHASWMENFPWTRLSGVVQPTEAVNLPNDRSHPALVGAAARAHYGLGNFGGLYQRDDADMQRLWQAGVEETRTLLEENWWPR
ncbi:MAG: creatininase family protein [Caldilineaceae bacterium]